MKLLSIKCKKNARTNFSHFLYNLLFIRYYFSYPFTISHCLFFTLREVNYTLLLSAMSRQVLPKIFLRWRVFKVETLQSYIVSFFYCSLKKKLWKI